MVLQGGEGGGGEKDGDNCPDASSSLQAGLDWRATAAGRACLGLCRSLFKRARVHERLR